MNRVNKSLPNEKMMMNWEDGWNESWRKMKMRSPKPTCKTYCSCFGRELKARGYGEKMGWKNTCRWNRRWRRWYLGWRISHAQLIMKAFWWKWKEEEEKGGGGRTSSWEEKRGMIVWDGGRVVLNGTFGYFCVQVLKWKSNMSTGLLARN